MLGLNDYIPTPILTQRGILDAKDVVPTDKVFEYRTGNLVEVQRVEKIPVQEVFKIEYNDGRYGYFNHHSNIFTGENHGIMPLHAAVDCKNILSRIIQYPIESFHTGAKNAPNPDAYIAGALLTHGNYDDKYINLPYGKNIKVVNDHLANRYNLEVSETEIDGYYRYHLSGTPTDACISWAEFFKDCDWAANTMPMSSPVLSQYQYLPGPRRFRFIMGAFDIGYDTDRFPDSVGLMCREESRLKDIQWILNSLGILSNVYYTHFQSDPDPVYILEVLGTYDGYPGCFYNIDSIEYNIHLFDRMLRKLHPFDLKIEKIEHIGRGWMYNISLQDPTMLYFDGNLLPRVSL